MVNFFDRLQKIYDKEIRECCDEKRKLLLDCLKENNREKEYVCKYEINSFKNCIEDYSNNFTNKYSRVTDFKIYY